MRDVCHDFDVSRVSRVLPYSLDIPDARRLVPGSGGYSLAIRAECTCVHPTVVPLEHGNLRIIIRVPNPRGFVSRRGDNSTPVRAERSAPHFVIVPEYGNLRACLRIPKSRAFVLGCG